MMSFGVSSVELLMEFVRHFSNNEFDTSKKYFAKAGSTLKVADAVKNSLDESALFVSEKDFCKRFVYVEPSDIHSLLSLDDAFVRNSQEEYVLSEKVAFDEREVSVVLSRVRKEITGCGFCSLAQFEFEDSKTLNDNALTIGALRKVFYNRYLSCDYAMRGQVVCAHGAEIDARVPLRACFRSHMELSIDQVLSVAEEYNIVKEMAIATANEELVRTDQDRFVSPSIVQFDVGAIDADLDRICTSVVTTFTSLGVMSDLVSVPGYSWNRYLLESYLRRESKKFMFMSHAHASREVAGVIVRRDSQIVDAIQAFAYVAVSNGVEADDNEVGAFLVATNCVRKRGASMVAQVISRMRDLYERRK